MMNKYDASQKLTGEQFKRIIGVRKATFAEMLSALRKGYADKHKRRGRHSRLPVELQLMMALEYLRQYATFAELGFNYGICESTAQNYVVWLEEMLTKSGKFRLPGKKKQHTIKTRLIVNKVSKETICTAHAECSCHDFRLYGESVGRAISGGIKAKKCDSGCQGILRLHENSETPKKKPKGGELTPEEKADNRRISCERILMENINAKIKAFKITANKIQKPPQPFPA
jgi:hypothetical protein